MALFDERGVGWGQDVVIVDAGERLALDGLPVPLAVAYAVVINDRFRRQAGADPHGAVPGFYASGFGQRTGARKLAPRSVHAAGAFAPAARRAPSRTAPGPAGTRRGGANGRAPENWLPAADRPKGKAPRERASS